MKQRFEFNNKDGDILDLTLPEVEAKILSDKINEGLRLIEDPRLCPKPRKPKCLIIRLTGKFLTSHYIVSV